MKPLLFTLGCVLAALAVLTTGSVAIAWIVAVIFHTTRLLGVH